jgi:hypothetical protein
VKIAGVRMVAAFSCVGAGVVKGKLLHAVCWMFQEKCNSSSPGCGDGATETE